MADKSLQRRRMRKTVDRVDVGVFGVPLRTSKWMRERRSTWGGLAVMAAGQAVVGLMIGLLAGVLLGVPANAFSIALLAFFAAGCAIGGPFSFSVWTVVLVEITGLVAGLAGGAWVASPSWWRVQAARLESGESLPFWFLIAVPMWMLFWVASSYGIARLFHKALEGFGLSTAYRAASRFKSEDDRIREEALAESDVSAVESRSVIEAGGDGTEALIMGSDKVERHREVETQTGGEPDSAPVPIANYLEIDEDDPDIMKAVGGSSTPTSSSDEEEISITIGSTTAALPMELTDPDLPAIPADTSGPIRAIQPPAVDARSSRSMVKKLQEILLAFDIAVHEGEDEEFLRDNEEHLARMSEEQKDMLRSMDNAGPLLGAITAIQRDRAADFVMGRSDPPSAVGTGQVPPADVMGDDVRDAGDDVRDAGDGEAGIEGEGRGLEVVSRPDAERDESDIDAVGQEAIVAPSVAALGSAFASMARRGRRDEDPAPEPIASTSANDDLEGSAPTGDAASAVTDAATDVDAEAEVIDEQPHTISAEGRDGGSVVFDVDVGRGDVGERASATTTEPSSENAVATPTTAGTAATETAASAGADSTDTGIGEDEEMNALIFNRVVCRQVVGLVSGASDPADKAADVLQFERDNPDVRVQQVIGSRSFDEHVGAADAVAVRHAWREVAFVLSQSNVERLVAEFARLNGRGRDLLERPFDLTQAILYSFESECLKLRTAGAVNDETISGTLELNRENEAVLQELRRTLSAKTERSTASQSGPGKVVRQKVASGDEEQATRGRGLLGAVLGRGQAGKDMVVATAAEDEPSSAADAIVEGTRSVDQGGGDDMNEADAGDVTRKPRHGDDDYVSPFAEGTVEHEDDVFMHEKMRERRRERAEAERAANEARERERERVRQDEERRLADERERVANEARELEDRQNLERRQRLAREDAVFVEAERAEQSSRARAAALEEDAARAKAEREKSELSRSRAEQAIVEQLRRKAEELPARFRTDTLVELMRSIEERRDARRALRRLSMDTAISGLEGVPEAVSNPMTRLGLEMEVVLAKEADTVVREIGKVSDATDPSDADSIRQTLDAEELKWFNRIESLRGAGASARRMLDESDRILIGMHEAKAGEGELARLRTRIASLETSEAEATRVARVAAEEIEGNREVMSRLERERDTAVQRLDAIRRERTGYKDDVFQRMLERHTQLLERSPVDGVYYLLSKDGKSLLVFLTVPSTSLANGTVSTGDTVISIARAMEFVFSKQQDITTETKILYYTDPRMRVYLDDLSLASAPIERSEEAFVNVLREAGIEISNVEGEVK